MDSIAFNKLLDEIRGRGLPVSMENVPPETEVDLTNLLPNTYSEDDIAGVVEDIVTEQLPSVTVRKIIGVARDVVLNDKQQLFCDTVLSGKDVILIGAAGTGKTTSMRGTTRALIDSERLLKLSRGTKYLHVGGYGGTILSFTRKAVNNIRHAVVDELKPHTLTIHKLLEYEPVYYQIEDDKKPGEFKNTMRFEPTRNTYNPLPEELQFVAFEESSMIGTELYRRFQEAMPHPHQEVFLGDIQQLPPVFGMAILGFKMLELPVIELTEVYRQARNSPIIDLAWKILEGNQSIFNYTTVPFTNNRGKPGKRAPALEEFTRVNEDGEVKFTIWQNKIHADQALMAMATQLRVWYENGYYRPEEDVILIPFNVSFGTIELNKAIHQFLGVKREAVVHEVIAGFEKHYLAVGDRVLYDKEDAVITDIRRNGEYMGTKFQPASIHLDRWGMMQEPLTQQEKLQADAEDGDYELTAMDAFLEGNIITERVNSASHIITVKLTYADSDDDAEVLSSAAHINNLLGGHALTVHKFQGSEAERVFFFMHQSHATMNQRELLYTAVTRAKKFLHIVAEPDTFWKGIKSQAVKGNSLAEKAEFFKGKKEEVDKLKEEEAQQLVKHNSLNLDFPVTARDKVVTISGQRAIRLIDLPSSAIKEAAQQSLEIHWKKVIDTFGYVGEIPTLSFAVTSRKIVGLCNFTHNVVKLNPVWLALAETDSEVSDIMLNEVIVHELCHHVAGRKFRDFKHDVYWKNCMRRMGYPAARFIDGLPEWMQAKDHLLTDILLRSEEVVSEEVIAKDEIE